MGFDHNCPEGANFGDSSFVPRPVRWEDAAEVRRWFSALEEGVKDLRGAARDRVRRKRHRVLSRHEARRQVLAAERALAALLQAGLAGWPAPREPDPEPGEGSPEGDPPFSSRRPTTPPERAG